MRDRLRQRSWNAHDFLGALDGLDDDLVDELSYIEAARAGIEGVPWDSGVDADAIRSTWVGHVRKYAEAVPSRIAQQVSDELHEIAPDETVPSLEDALAAIDAKLEAIRSSVTRYAEPPWGAGWNGYGEALADKNILMVWVLDDGAAHCEDCPEIAAGSPYEQLPTWPGYGDTACLDRCKCTVQADQASWDASLGGEE